MAIKPVCFRGAAPSHASCHRNVSSNMAEMPGIVILRRKYLHRHGIFVGRESARHLVAGLGASRGAGSDSHHLGQPGDSRAPIVVKAAAALTKNAESNDAACRINNHRERRGGGPGGGRVDAALGDAPHARRARRRGARPALPRYRKAAEK